MMMSVGIDPWNAMWYWQDKTKLSVDIRIDGTALDHSEVYTENFGLRRYRLDFNITSESCFFIDTIQTAISNYKPALA